MDRFKFVPTVAIAFMFCVSSCKVQLNEVNVKINVIDEKGNNIPEAKIKLYNNDTLLLNQTNLDGVLEFESLKKGKYKIDVTSFGNYKMSNISIKLKSPQEKFIIEVKSVEVGHVDVEWDGGWVTFEDKNGNVKSIRSKRK